MMQQESLNFNPKPILDRKEGLRLRDEGIKRAGENAGSTWMSEAVESFIEYVKRNGPCAVEDFRADWIESGKEQPSSHYAWGALGSAAAKTGLIKSVGYRKASSKKTHGHEIKLWVIA